MELKVLRSFVVLCEELHFGRASERLCIVQPALSMQIKALERELGVQLFDRHHNRVELTPAGRLFLPGARATLDQARDAVERVKADGRGEIGRRRIGVISSVLPWYLPRLLRELHHRFPLIELDLKDMPTPDQLRGLKERKLDFGFVRLPVETGGIQCAELFAETFIVALPKDHPLTAKATVAPADLAGVPCCVLGRRFAPGYYDGLLLALARDGLTLQIDRELGEFTTMLALVEAGMGIGLLPRLAMAAPPPNIVARPLAVSGHVSRVGLAWNDLDPLVSRTFHRVALAVTPPADV